MAAIEPSTVFSNDTGSYSYWPLNGTTYIQFYEGIPRPKHENNFHPFAIHVFKLFEKIRQILGSTNLLSTNLLYNESAHSTIKHAGGFQKCKERDNIGCFNFTRWCHE